MGSQNNRCVRASPEHLLPVFVVVCVGMGGVYGEENFGDSSTLPNDKSKGTHNHIVGSA